MLARSTFAFCLVTLAACGSEPPASQNLPGTAATLQLVAGATTAQGPIGAACNTYNRKTANAQRCGCIQAAADLTLSKSDQQKATRFFAEPELLQAIKLSDTPKNERFWYTWARFAETAEQMCSST